LFLSQVQSLSRPQRLDLVERGCGGLSVVRQCHLLGASRSSWYYEAVLASEKDLELMKAYSTVRDAHPGIGSYLRFFDEERPHQALGYRTLVTARWLPHAEGGLPRGRGRVRTEDSGRLSKVTFLAKGLRLADRNLKKLTDFRHFRQPAATVHSLLTRRCRTGLLALLVRRESRKKRPRRCPNDGVHPSRSRSRR